MTDCYSCANADLLKTVDETVTAFPRIWSRAEDGVGAVLQEGDADKASPIHHKLASYPSLGVTRVCSPPVCLACSIMTICIETLSYAQNIWEGRQRQAEACSTKPRRAAVLMLRAVFNLGTLIALC